MPSSTASPRRCRSANAGPEIRQNPDYQDERTRRAGRRETERRVRDERTHFKADRSGFRTARCKMAAAAGRTGKTDAEKLKIESAPAKPTEPDAKRFVALSSVPEMDPASGLQFSAGKPNLASGFRAPVCDGRGRKSGKTCSPQSLKVTIRTAERIAHTLKGNRRTIGSGRLRKDAATWKKGCTPAKPSPPRKHPISRSAAEHNAGNTRRAPAMMQAENADVR